jgi:hypothetical protein
VIGSITSDLEHKTAVESVVHRDPEIVAKVNPHYPCPIPNFSGVLCHFSSAIQFLASIQVNSKLIYSDLPENIVDVKDFTAPVLVKIALLTGFFTSYLFGGKCISKKALNVVIEALMDSNFMKSEQDVVETIWK